MDPSEIQEKPESTIGQRPERLRKPKEKPAALVREGGEVESEERRAPAKDEPATRPAR